MGITEQVAARLSNIELAGEFLRSRGKDRIAGRALMERAIDRTPDLDPDTLLEARLKKRDGSPATTPEGRPVDVGNYLNDLAKPIAIQGMIRFVTMDESSPDFPAEQRVMTDTFKKFT